MIRKLLATTAVATLIASGAYAQSGTTTDAAATAPASSTTAPAIAPAIALDGHLASNLIGANVYNGTGNDAANVGEVSDLVLDKDGKVTALVVGVGGFLGIGQKDVAVDYASAKWTERDGKRWLVIPATKEDLTAQAAFDRSAYNPPAPATSASNTTQPAGSTMASGDTAASGGSAMAPGSAATTDGASTMAVDATQTGAIDRSKLTPANVATFSADDFIGTTVYGQDDSRVGEIGDVALDKDGKVDAIVVDVGGFLGMGEKHVAVGLDNLQFMQDQSGKTYLYTHFTKDQLKAQAAYDKSSYAQNRDQQRMNSTQ